MGGKWYTSLFAMTLSTPLPFSSQKCDLRIRSAIFSLRETYSEASEGRLFHDVVGLERCGQ
jgi:hypothetical protein